MGWFSIGAAALGLLGAKKTNSANAKMYDKQIEWEREKALNAHQWEVEDLRKAGLNPILSAGGPGASVGSPSVIPAQNEVSSAINSAIATANAKADVELKNEQSRQLGLNNDLFYQTLEDQIALAKQNLANSAKQGMLLDENIKKTIADTEDIRSNNYLLKRAIELGEGIIKNINNANGLTYGIDDVTSGAKNLVTDVKNEVRKMDYDISSKLDPWFDIRGRRNMTRYQRQLATYGKGGRSRVNE